MIAQAIVRLTMAMSLMFCTLIGSTTYANTNPALRISLEEKQILTEIRNNVFGGARLDAAFRQATISGQEPPIFPYEIDDRGLIIWELDPAQTQAFANSVGLFPPYQITSVNPIVIHRSPTDATRFEEFLEQKGWQRLRNILFPKKFYVVADIGLTTRAEQGYKVDLKTFVQIPGSDATSLYRFATYKATPGTDLLQLSNLTPAQIQLTSLPQQWSGTLLTSEGNLHWTVPLKTKKADIPKINKRMHFSQWYLDASEKVSGPMGSFSRYYYDGSSVSAKFIATKPRFTDIHHDFSWGQFVIGSPEAFVLAEVSEFLVQPVTAPVQVLAGGVKACALATQSSNSSELFSRLIGCVLEGQNPQDVFATLFGIAQSKPTVLPAQTLPTLYYALLDIYQGLGILYGIEKPKMFFSLLTAPKTLFINFEIPANRVRAFEKAFLPSSFKLAKMRFYPEQRKAVYAVSLNIYQSVGQNLNGYRAEWSTYVINPEESDPKPRFSVLEAQTNIGGFDPIVALERYLPGMDFSNPATLAQLIEPPSDQFTYTENMNDGIQVRLRDNTEGIVLDVDIQYPPAPQMLKTNPTTEWMEANDFVYWGKVADILKYDQQVMFADLLVFPVKSTDLISDSTFAEYVKPKPLPIIIWNGGQDIALEPWGNLEAVIVDE
ncbi:hypothetical protein SO574_18685 [Vibrio alfacsensis]|uniref:hypothetical protein n=1 Tax=Vibrio alfacsensis TaxID=1074311 RepID=UPI002ADE85C6|nr:hypothetical protein [Vibrio alfacsensis]WQE77802.1 hypothetical protein SO574_18685 [Vibrio alfacsensis]